MSLLSVSDLRIRYGGCEAPAVDGLSFSLGASDSLGIVGESGAGKSQTALAIMGLLPDTATISGSIKVDGTEVVGASKQTLRQLRRQTLSMIFQDPATALNPYLRVGAQLDKILRMRPGMSRKAAAQKSISLLERVGLPDPEKQYRAFPHQLSGGMRQRALIAAALIGDPALIVADEPTTALDVTVQAQILELLRRLQSEMNTALLMISHDLGVISQSAQNILVIDKGKTIEEGRCTEVFSSPQHPHTARLLEAAPVIDAELPKNPARSDDVLLDVQDITIGFRERRGWRHRNFVAVDSLSISVNKGEVVAVVGESGSGKTSLARSIAGLLPAQHGKLQLLTNRLPWQVSERSKSVRKLLQMVFQDPVSSLSPAMRVAQILAEPLTVHQTAVGIDDMQKAVADILRRVGLDADLKDRYPHELSGGQAQRVAIARALIVEPSLLICDEALAALDGSVRREILALLKTEQERSGLSILLITHDLGVVREISDRVVVMFQGKVCETATNEMLFASPQHDYTKKLLAAVPRLARRVA